MPEHGEPRERIGIAAKSLPATVGSIFRTCGASKGWQEEPWDPWKCMYNELAKKQRAIIDMPTPPVFKILVLQVGLRYYYWIPVMRPPGVGVRAGYTKDVIFP